VSPTPRVTSFVSIYHIITTLTNDLSGLMFNAIDLMINYTWVTLVDFDYPVRFLIFLLPKIWLSNILALSVPDEKYYRKASYALNLISTF
jgi:hypothetical protein